MNDLLLLIISSPSGAGKTTLTRELLRTFKDLSFSVSHTTRKPRGTEVDGRDYHFIDEASFRDRIAAGDFVEWAEVHGNLYGTSLSEIERARSEQRMGLLFDVDYQGALEKVGAITPVPGGVGPVTVAMLLSNTIACAKGIA